MVELSSVLSQLSKVGYKARLWQRSEVKELCKIMHEDEKILQATNGYYEGGFCLLVATDTRLMLIDRKPMFLTLDSIAYGMIQEVSFNYRLFNSTIHIFTSNKCLDFNSWNHSQIRSILSTTQQAMREQKNKQNLQNTGGMQYEHLDLPEFNPQEVPTMPSPMQSYIVNSNAQQVSPPQPVSNVNGFSISPENLSTDSKLDPYAAPALTQRHYLRRYY